MRELLSSNSRSRTVFLFLILTLAQLISSIGQAKTLKTNANALEGKQQQLQNCSCGRHVRNMTSVKFIAGKIYDTIYKLGVGLDAYVEHAYSPALNRCVAIKRCEEDRIRLNKCTRELEVMKALNAMEEANNSSGRSHFVKLIDYEVRDNYPCSKETLFADFVHMVVIGGDRRRRKRQDLENRSNCSLVQLVEELGDRDLLNYWRKTRKSSKNKKTVQKLEEEDSPLSAAASRKVNGNNNGATTAAVNLNQQIVGEVEQALEQMHSMGMAHKDLHPDNVLLVRPQPFATASAAALPKVKLMDFSWTCCFQPAKCGPALAKLLPQCEEKEALADDKFGLNDVRRTADGV